MKHFAVYSGMGTPDKTFRLCSPRPQAHAIHFADYLNRAGFPFGLHVTEVKNDEFVVDSELPLQGTSVILADPRFLELVKERLG